MQNRYLYTKTDLDLVDCLLNFLEFHVVSNPCGLILFAVAVVDLGVMNVLEVALKYDDVL